MYNKEKLIVKKTFHLQNDIYIKTCFKAKKKRGGGGLRQKKNIYIFIYMNIFFLNEREQMKYYVVDFIQVLRPNHLSVIVLITQDVEKENNNYYHFTLLFFSYLII